MIRTDRGEELVTVGNVKMTEEEFWSLYPGGILIQVVRKDKRPNDADV